MYVFLDKYLEIGINVATIITLDKRAKRPWIVHLSSVNSFWYIFETGHTYWWHFFDRSICLNYFCRRSPGYHFCQISLNSVYWSQRRRCLKFCMLVHKGNRPCTLVAMFFNGSYSFELFLYKITQWPFLPNHFEFWWAVSGEDFLSFLSHNQSLTLAAMFCDGSNLFYLFL